MLAHLRSRKCLPVSTWTTVFTEEAGTGNGAQYDKTDIRVLHLANPPFDVTKGNYRVRMEWGSGKDAGWAQFTVRAYVVEF